MPENQPIISRKLRQGNQPIPNLLRPAAKQRPNKAPQPLNWQQFTLAAALRRARELKRRRELVITGMKAMPAGEGRILFLGAIGWIEELTIAGEWVAHTRDRYIEAYDDYSHATDSILDGPRVKSATRFLKVPPTVHGRVQLHDGWPDLSQDYRDIVFCCLAADTIEPLRSMPSRLFKDAALVGRYEQLQELAKVSKFRVLPVTQWEDWFLVKAVV